MFNAHINEYTPFLQNEPQVMRNVLDDTQAYSLGETRRLTPVRTGKLKGAWAGAITNGDTLIVSNDTPYAGYVERGTRYFKGRKMLQRSIPMIERYLLARLKVAYDQLT